jgi:hypothetical protein
LDVESAVALPQPPQNIAKAPSVSNRFLRMILAPEPRIWFAVAAVVVAAVYLFAWPIPSCLSDM